MKATTQSPLRWLAIAALTILSMAAWSGSNLVCAEDEKKDEKKSGPTEIDEILKKLPPNTPKEQIDRIRQALEENRKRMDDARQRAKDVFQDRGGKFGRLQGRNGPVPQNRLGVRLQAPDETLTAQLGLADGTGLVLIEVPEGSVAARAGFMANDVLLKFNGKDVSSTAIEFTSDLDAIKTGTPVDAVVLRNGKEETIKGIKLPEVVPPPASPRFNQFPRRIQIEVIPPPERR